MKEDPPRRKRDAEQKFDNAFSTCIHALRCAVNHTMKTSHRVVVFNRDMLMDVQLLTDLASIHRQRQQQIDDNAKNQIIKQIDYNYQVGEMVKMHVYDSDKLEERFMSN